MKLLIAAGGTGGHVYPGIAVAQEIVRREPESEVLFVGTARGLETKIVPAAGFQLSLIHSEGLKGVGLRSKLAGLSVLPRSFVEARQIIRQFRPHVAVGAGGYVSGPVMLTAAIMGVPTLIMDSNALPGFTNRVLARFVDKAAVTFEEAAPYFRGKAVVTGNPVRKEFFEIEQKPRGERYHILIFGGSQGSRAINDAMIAALAPLSKSQAEMSFTHQTGAADHDRVLAAYRDSRFVDADVRPFIQDIFTEFAKADLIICRAGATTCAELCAAGKASVMIPLPTAADDHQRKNAEAMQAAGATRMILQSELTGNVLAETILDLTGSPELLTRMEESARRLARPDAAERAADLVVELKKNV